MQAHTCTLLYTLTNFLVSSLSRSYHTLLARSINTHEHGHLHTYSHNTHTHADSHKINITQTQREITNTRALTHTHIPKHAHTRAICEQMLYARVGELGPEWGALLYSQSVGFPRELLPHLPQLAVDRCLVAVSCGVRCKGQ